MDPGAIYQKGALDSQPQVIKVTSCLPMVGGSLRGRRLLPTQTGRHDIAEILLKVALSTINQIKLKSNPLLYYYIVFLVSNRYSPSFSQRAMEAREIRICSPTR